jgi:hypothetical protein
MEDAQPVPQLTDSQKLRIVLIQRNFLDAQQLQAKLQGDLQVTLNAIAQENNIDPEKWLFALDTLTVVPKP